MSGSDYLRGARIAIVGAGVVGSALAYRLAQAGAAVTVVERAHTGGGASGNTFGWLNGWDKAPRDYHRLNMLGIRDQEDLADELGGAWAHVTGTLHWAPAADGGAAVLDAQARRMLGWGLRVDRLTADEVRRDLEPDLVLDGAAPSSIYYVPRSGWLEPVAMAHGALSAAVERYAATVVRGDVAGLPVTGGMIDRLDLADGSTLEADVVIDAAGPDAPRLAALAGTSIPVERSPGLLLVTGPAPVRLGRVVWGHGLHVRPDGGGRTLIQWEPLDDSARDGGEPLSPDSDRVRDAFDRATVVLPDLAATRVEAVRLGIRAVPADGFPIVGFDPSVGNLYHVVTHSGITLAARLALLVTEELSGGDAAPLEGLRPPAPGITRWSGSGAAE